MSFADWKRYYIIAYDKPPAYTPVVWRNREACLMMLASEQRACSYPHSPKPIGIVRIKGRKNNVKLQRWFAENAL